MAPGDLLARISRRDFLKLSAAGVSATALSGWLPVLAARAAQSGTKHKACILLWMDGGPSTIDIWDLKPGTSTGGEFKPISTAGDMQISEHMPLTAKVMDKLSIVRSMSTREADHNRGEDQRNSKAHGSLLSAAWR